MSDDTLKRLSDTIASRLKGDPNVSYVAKLHAKGEDAALKKVGEEAAEFVMACKDAGYAHGNDERYPVQRAKIVAEAADLWFHSLVALARHGASATEVIAELARREGLSGIEEKESRPK